MGQDLTLNCPSCESRVIKISRIASEISIDHIGAKCGNCFAKLEIDISLFDMRYKVRSSGGINKDITMLYPIPFGF